MSKLSITWQVRLVNAALSALILVALILLAQARIRAVLYDALDTTLTEQAREMANRPSHAPPRNNGQQWRGDFPPPRDGFRGQHEPFDRPPPQGGQRRGEPPPLRFGALTLLPPRRVPFDGTGREPWSVAGRNAAVRAGGDKRTETTGDGTRLRVVSLRVPETDRDPAMIVQAAGNTQTIDATLREINAALYALLLPLAALAAVVGAFFTELALAPVRRLAQSVGEIESSNLSARLPEPGGNDAFDTLAVRLNALLSRLDQAFARQKRFTGAASHELRTPLAVIKSATSLLLETPETLSPLQSRTLDRADQSADRANRLITDLLTLTRTENGTLPVRKIAFRLAPFLDDVAADFPNPPVPVVVTAPESVSIHTDPDMVRRLLQNLVHNALRHTTHGQVSVLGNVSGETLTLVVADTGEGIAAEALPRLGEPFYRPDSSRARDTGGAGLGLSLCREIVATLGGTLHIQSTPGRGTTVTATIPASAR